MSNPSFKLDDNAPTVSWAESRSGGEGDFSASQVYFFRIYLTNKL
jgi:heterogeneous nuclear ribonucleoprotein R